MSEAFVAAYRAEGEVADPTMAAGFALAAAHGLDDIAMATPTEARRLLRGLAAIGRVDLAFGRIFEGHINARQLVAAYAPDMAIGRDDRLGVWNSNQPGEPLGEDGVRFVGGKNYASGVGVLTHALVTTEADDPAVCRMWLVPVGAMAVEGGWWAPVGMARTNSHIARLDGVPLSAARAVGGPGDYQRQPWFFAGAIRFVAVHAGGVHALFEHVRDHLVCADRAAHPHQRHRIARLFLLAQRGYQAIDAVAARWCPEGSPEDGETLIARVAAARVAVAEAADEALVLAQKAVGLPGLFETHPIARAITDLMVYLRQPNPDGAFDAVGDAAAAGRLRPDA